MTIPASQLVPGVYIAIDNSRAVSGAVVAPFRTIVMAQKLSTGTATAETLVPVFGEADAQNKFGVGSMLAEMFAYWFASNPTQEVFAVALDDASGSVAATKTLTVTASSVLAGTIFLYINDRQIQIGINTADTDSGIATLIANAINAYPDLPLSAAAVGAVVTVTAKNKGTIGNGIKVQLNWGDTDEYPSGVSIAVATGVTGATDPDLADAVAAVPDEIFSLFVSPYKDSANLLVMKNEIDRRFSDTVQLEGHYITAMEGSAGTVNAVTSVQNSQHLVVVACGNDPLTPSYLTVAAVSAQVALEAEADPARPFQTLPLRGVVGDTPTNRYNGAELQSILANGGATLYIDAGGTVRIQRLVTTYKTNANGSPDPSYRDSNTLFTNSYFRMSLRARISQKYPRHKVADDGVSFGAGQPVVTPSILRSEFLDLFRSWEQLGLAENIDQYASEMIVQRNATDRNRIDFILPPDLVNQFRIAAGSIQFLL